MILQVSSNSSTGSPNLSGEENSISDAASLDSSLSTASAAYEDIDDPLQVERFSYTFMNQSIILPVISLFLK